MSSRRENQVTWRDDNHDPTADLVLIGLLCLLAWGVVALGHRAAGECAAGDVGARLPATPEFTQ